MLPPDQAKHAKPVPNIQVHTTTIQERIKIPGAFAARIGNEGELTYHFLPLAGAILD